MLGMTEMLIKFVKWNRTLKKYQLLCHSNIGVCCIEIYFSLILKQFLHIDIKDVSQDFWCEDGRIHTQSYFLVSLRTLFFVYWLNRHLFSDKQSKMSSLNPFKSKWQQCETIGCITELSPRNQLAPYSQLQKNQLCSLS